MKSLPSSTVQAHDGGMPEMKIDGNGYGRLIHLMILSWISMLGVDFLVHGGILARYYFEPDPFLLPPDAAFRFIPIGYLSFLLLAFLIVWLMTKMRIYGWLQGCLFGLKFGLLVWGALALGLLSISTAKIGLLIGWWLGQSLELGIAGAVVGRALEKSSMRSLWIMVIVFVIILITITILLQSLGLAPSLKA